MNHRFNDDWAIHSRFLANFAHGDSTFVNPAPAFNPARAFDQTTGLMQRNIFSQAEDSDDYATNLDLTGKFNLGFTKHNVLLGFDFYRSFETYGIQGLWITPNPALAINVFNPAPSYGIPQSVFDTTLAKRQRATDRSMFYNQWEGIYFQDQITLWDKLHIMGGGRYDWTETGRGNGLSYPQANSVLKESGRRFDSGFSPRVGILYDPIKEFSIYGNWTTSFGANNGISATGSSFDPQIGEQFEAGVKTSLFDERLLGTLAYYHVTKDNLLTPDLSTADPNDSKATGRQRS